MEHRRHDEAAVSRTGRVGEVELDDVGGHRAVAEDAPFGAPVVPLVCIW
jgi:hypothetical protein